MYSIIHKHTYKEWLCKIIYLFNMFKFRFMFMFKFFLEWSPTEMWERQISIIRIVFACGQFLSYFYFLGFSRVNIFFFFEFDLKTSRDNLFVIIFRQQKFSSLWQYYIYIFIYISNCFQVCDAILVSVAPWLHIIHFVYNY